MRCHRRLVAELLEEKLGIVVPELGHDRRESVAFSERVEVGRRAEVAGGNANAVLNGGRLSRMLAPVVGNAD